MELYWTWIGKKIWLKTENSFPYRSSGKLPEGMFQTTNFSITLNN